MHFALYIGSLKGIVIKKDILLRATISKRHVNFSRTDTNATNYRVIMQIKLHNIHCKALLRISFKYLSNHFIILKLVF